MGRKESKREEGGRGGDRGGGEGRGGEARGGEGGVAVPCDTVTYTLAKRYGSSKECSALAPVNVMYKYILV